jgi:hypothetical protein
MTDYATAITTLTQRDLSSLGPRPSHTVVGYLTLDEDGELTYGTEVRVGGDGTSMAVWLKRALRFEVHPSTDLTELHTALTGELAALLDRVHAGHTVIFDGSNRSGSLTANADEAAHAVTDYLCGIARVDLCRWEVNEWFAPDSKEHLAGLVASATSLVDLAAQLVKDAESDNAILDVDAVERYLQSCIDEAA